jgi:hypothetical protein
MLGARDTVARTFVRCYGKPGNIVSVIDSGLGDGENLKMKYLLRIYSHNSTQYTRYFKVKLSASEEVALGDVA